MPKLKRPILYKLATYICLMNDGRLW